MKKTAVRNLRLCTKDCLCLYVCPTGATDTENSIIDVNKCIGCGACAEACPSGAISLVPDEYPKAQEKKDEVLDVLTAMTRSKMEGAAAAKKIGGMVEDDTFFRVSAAIEKSQKLIAEDLARESGYMLPQGEGAKALLEKLLAEETDPAFPREAAEKLLATLW